MAWLLEHMDGADVDRMFRHICKLGLEGIVAKRRDRPYRSGGMRIGSGEKSDAPGQVGRP
jgi:hypothetical protein